MTSPRKLLSCYNCKDIAVSLIPFIMQDEKDKSKDEQNFLCFNCMSIAIEESHEIMRKYEEK